MHICMFISEIISKTHILYEIDTRSQLFAVSNVVDKMKHTFPHLFVLKEISKSLLNLKK